MTGKIQQLRDFLRPLTEKGTALAFSGGVDSSLLLAVLAEMHQKSPFPFLLLNAVSTLQSSSDREAVQKISAGYGFETEFLPCDVLALPQVRHNAPLRCYHCKKLLFETMISYAKLWGIHTILEGSHSDDLKAYRPGRKALEELGVISPLARLEITKTEIRNMAAALKINTARKPSTPCLATRFDYGTELTEEILSRASAGEDFLHTLLPETADLRLRVHGTLGRIEVAQEYFGLLLEQRELIIKNLTLLGFEKITLDLAGFASGSFDGKLKE